ncbi:MAG: TylF/MycF/NovP-related O-methyltransferase, partial [Anaerolineales bacterium]
DLTSLSCETWWKRVIARLVRLILGADLVRHADPESRREGRVWPKTAHTMIGAARLDNLRTCVEDVLNRGVPGDLIEAGVWRGGACIFMRGLLKAHAVSDRVVWVADSFRGLPPPLHKVDKADPAGALHKDRQLAISLEQVKANFAAYDLLDDQVRFLKGWFRDTLPQAPMERLAVMRLDGDLYESTMDGLVSLYPKLSSGGYVIIDDYGNIAACKQAVHDYRAKHAIREPIRRIDWAGAYWQKRLP